MLEESARECDTALSLDAGDYRLRSCSITFEEVGNYSRSLDFLQSDMGSQWATGNLVIHYIRTGNLAQAREMSEKIGDGPRNRLTRACLNHAPSSEVERIAKQQAPEILANPDSENRFTAAAAFAFCGQKEIALQLLKSGVAGKYCGYTEMQNDPILANLRGTSEFAEILSAAKKCQSDFLAERSQAAR
jgi:hypothetical protein